MKEINTDIALAQLRMNSALKTAETRLHPEKAMASDFSSLLQQSIDKVNALQKQSGELTKNFELGSANTSLEEVMIARQKAGIAFESVLQVRNKLISAYKEIMSMQV